MSVKFNFESGPDLVISGLPSMDPHQKFFHIDFIELNDSYF